MTTTATRNWITPGATVAVISTGRTTGIQQISMDTIDTVSDTLITTLGHRFDRETLEGPGDLAKMYDWRMANPASPEVRHGLAVQNRQKALRVVEKYQDALNAAPTDTEVIALLILSLNQYREAVINADAAAQLLQVSQ